MTQDAAPPGRHHSAPVAPRFPSTLLSGFPSSLFGPGLSQHARLITLASAQDAGFPESLVVGRFHGHKILIFSILLSALPVSGKANAANFESRSSFSSGKNLFSFKQGKRTVRFDLDIHVNGWSINCTRTRAVVWGVDLGLSQSGVPSVSKVYIINLDSRKIINHYTITRGPFSAAFSADHRTVIVDDYVIDQNSGKVLSMTDNVKIATEACPSFPGKHSEQK
ncbi:hypothetical protein [Herbaspirillum huttiense]|uniref:Uncharacterized protein n=1 Tax=Herbaspirillum huttiense subsp. lycopersici TaxID=3074428 RepID=A0ABU2EFI2_9BURK|nr:hypothetical protein [Herbaspirillum huttiense]MDR9846648.1 hypothetical protein [Herbaspirillum huttiense SE1]